VADPTVVAANAAFQDAFEQLRSAVEGASVETLNRRPAGEDTNSIAVIATHAMMSTRMWLGCAFDAPVPPRDRPSEFLVTTQGADALLAVVDAAAADCRAILATEAPFDPGASRVEPPTSRVGGPTQTVSAGWALLHAVGHLGEHAGQASLTRQVLDQVV
jgi:Protein of unknown function (DUF664)